MASELSVKRWSTLTLSDWASSDFRLLVTFFSSSSRSPHFLYEYRERFWHFLNVLDGAFLGDSLTKPVSLHVTSQMPSCLQLCDLRPLFCSLQLTLQDHQFTGNLTWKRCKITAEQHKVEMTSDLCEKSRNLDPRVRTSSYLRSASSAMCLASLSCISWISIFSSSFMALFSITFMPLISRKTNNPSSTWP